MSAEHWDEWEWVSIVAAAKKAREPGWSPQTRLREASYVRMCALEAMRKRVVYESAETRIALKTSRYMRMHLHTR